MTLTGRSAEEHPEVNALAAIRYGIVTHAVRAVGKVESARITAGPGQPALGHADPETGIYRTVAAGMSEAERREAGLRRNGRPRRKNIT